MCFGGGGGGWVGGVEGVSVGFLGGWGGVGVGGCVCVWGWGAGGGGVGGGVSGRTLSTEIMRPWSSVRWRWLMHLVASSVEDMVTKP